MCAGNSGSSVTLASRAVTSIVTLRGRDHCHSVIARLRQSKNDAVGIDEGYNSDGTEQSICENIQINEVR